MLPTSGRRSGRELAALLDTLDGRQFGDIAIRLFHVEHDGIVFGLVDETGQYREDEEDEDDGSVELYPEGLGFHEPWDGEYDT